MNLKELSQKLGLSQTTVSRALNGYPEVGENTRLRVLKMAAELNYQPNRFAKSLATGKSGHVGIVLPLENNLMVTPLFNDFLCGFTSYLMQKNMDLTIMPVAADQEIATYRQLAHSGRVDGIAVIKPLRDDPRIEHLMNMGLPFIVHGRLQPTDGPEVFNDIPFAYLDIDNKGAFERATSLLLNMGHKRIVLINDDSRYTFAYHRLMGYQCALEAKGVSYDPMLVYEAEMIEEKGYQAAKHALECLKPTAFLVSSVILTLGVKRAIREKGLQLGQHISLITHDDDLPYLQTAKFSPPLTAVSSSLTQAGYFLGNHLYNIIESGNKLRPQQVLDVDLIVRGSTTMAAD